MKKLAPLSKTAVLIIALIGVALFSCFDSREDGRKPIPPTTSRIEYRKPFTVAMVKTAHGIMVNEDGSMVHRGAGEATLISKIIEPAFSTFHFGSMAYIINEKANFVELRERLKIHFRLTMDGGRTWTEWNDDTFTILSTENMMSDEVPDSLFVHLLSGARHGRLYNGVEIKIVSAAVNQGKKIIDLLDFNFKRKSTEYFEDRRREKENVRRKKKVTERTHNDFPEIQSRRQWGVTEEEDEDAIAAWDPAGVNANGNPNSYYRYPSSSHIFLHNVAHEITPDHFYIHADSSWAEFIERQILNPHIRRFGDIGYHFIIDPNGVIYEGRLTALEMVEDPSYFVKGAQL